MSKGSYLIPLPRRIVSKEGEVNLKNFSLSIKGDLERIEDFTLTLMEYWTTQEKSPIWAARAANKGILYDETKGWDNIVYDQRWNKEWKEELPDLEKKILEKFSTPLDLEKDLGEDYLFLFRDYLGEDFPKCLGSENWILVSETRISWVDNLL